MTTEHFVIMDRSRCWFWIVLLVVVAVFGASKAAPPPPIPTESCGDGGDCAPVTSSSTTNHETTENPNDEPNISDNNSETTATEETTSDPEFTTLLEDEEKVTEKEPSLLLNAREEINTNDPDGSDLVSDSPTEKITVITSEEEPDKKEGLEIHEKPISLISDDFPVGDGEKEVRETNFTETTSETAPSSAEPEDSGTSTVADDVKSEKDINENGEVALKMKDDQEDAFERVDASTTTSSMTEELSTTVSKTPIPESDTSTREDPTAPNVDKFSESVDIEGYAADSPFLESASVEERSDDVMSIVSTTTSDEVTEVQKYISGSNLDLVAAVQFFHYHDKESSEQCNKLVSAHWDYATDLSEDNKQKQLFQTLEYQKFCKEAWTNATSFAWKSFNDTVLRRWFKGLSILGVAVLSEDKLKQLNELKAEMKSIYSTAKVCKYKKDSSGDGDISEDSHCNLALDPDLTRIMAKSRDYDELLHAWKSWRDSAGAPIREKYWNFVEISNEAARLNGFRDTGELWREAYESDTFEQDLQELWEQLKPLYENLHAYVRRRLISHYGQEKIREDGPIPAHLFGNMWAQSWVSLMDIVQPFPGKPSLDITPTMEAKNMTALEMFKISEEFFTSLGLKAMPEKFWNYSMIEKPADREVICHASAWDFCNGEDFRIKQCTDVTMEDLITVHHEMGHIQYFLQYAKQPNVFREGANPGFHEAIGDVLALSVSTPMHLKSIGLLEDVADDPEGDLNFLMSAAFEKVAFLPYGYLIDLWRWGLFNGNISKEQMNSKYWEFRLKYQGICPPVSRTEDDFDPGAKYHIPGNTPYIRYFVSHIIQFQMHKALCDASGHEGPLHKCDIYQSQAAGQILSQVMELGSSEHWSEVMKIMTGGATDKMDARPILEYFDPLLQYLKQQNENETLGWKSDSPLQCP